MRAFHFVLRERRFLAAGFLLTWGSSFGQTFFVSVFGEGFRAHFELDHGDYGAAYSAATVASGLLILQFGRLIDVLDLRVVAAAVVLGVAAAAGVVAVAPTVAVLILGFFGLRFFGQGLCSHTAMTAMGRYYDRDRGVAMSVAGAGHAVGEAMLPTIAVVLIAAMGWRAAWGTVAGVAFVVLLPAVLLLLAGHGRRHSDWLARLDDEDRLPDEPATPVGSGGPVSPVSHVGSGSSGSSGSSGRPGETPAAEDVPTSRRQWTRGEALRDPRFALILPAVAAPGFIVTGIFFHQGHLVDVRGWTDAWFAGSFAVFAATQVPCGLAAGPLVDRIGAVRLLPTFTLPMVAGLLVLGLVEHRIAAPVFMGLTGMTAGLAGPIVGATWAELYGVRHLGAIRALVTALLVLGTAGSPILLGRLFDAGVAPSALFLVAAVGTVVAAALAAAGLRARRPRHPGPGHPASESRP